jgi:hypothetical protein
LFENFGAGAEKGHWVRRDWLAAEEAERREAEGVLCRAKLKIVAALGADAVARDVFLCLCDGMVKRLEIAAKLGIDAKAVSAERKRLNRKLEKRRGLLTEN